ncbi:MAG: hypothetical protein AB7V16_13515 [Vulcanibacillus sp.]
MKKIIIISLTLSLILGVGVVYAYKNLSQKAEGEVIELNNFNNEDFFEMGKQFSGNESNTNSEELSSSLKKLNINRYNALIVQFTKIDGLKIEDAKERAMEGLILEVALTQAALNRGIVVTDDEAKKTAQEFRNLLENPTEDTFGINNEAVNKFIEGLGITEEEYWNEFAIDGYKQQLLQFKLRNDVINGIDPKNAEKVWEDFMENTINEYKKHHNIEIQEFKIEAGVNF